MRTLAIDYGRVRLGLALSDEEGVVASPLPPLPRAHTDLDEISRLVLSRGVGQVVVGLPVSMNGNEGEMAMEARAFAAQIGIRTHLPVSLFDERWTSSEAERALLEGDVSRKRRRELRDGLAAVLILQAYLASTASHGGRRPPEEGA